MEKKELKEMTEVFAKSLDDTQRNAVDTDALVQQVCAMSGQDLHKQIITGIMADDETNLEKKVDLVEKLSASYDQRLENNTRRIQQLQETQAQNVQAASNSCISIWEVISSVGVFVLIVGAAFTPVGRNLLLTGAAHRLTA